jgi:hypothetical protein
MKMFYLKIRSIISNKNTYQQSPLSINQLSNLQQMTPVTPHIDICLKSPILTRNHIVKFFSLFLIYNKLKVTPNKSKNTHKKVTPNKFKVLPNKLKLPQKKLNRPPKNFNRPFKKLNRPIPQLN